MDEEFIEREIVYIRNMRFADDPNSIDIRLNGRPYMILSVSGGIASILKISSSKKAREYCYHEVYLKQRHKPKVSNGRRKKKNKAKPSYIDLRHVIQIPVEQLTLKVQEFGTEVNGRRISWTREKISEKDFKIVLEKLNDLIEINKLRVRACMLYSLR